MYEQLKKRRGLIKPARCLKDVDLIGVIWDGKWKDMVVGDQFMVSSPDIEHNIKHAQITAEYEAYLLVSKEKDDDGDEAAWFWQLPEDPKTENYVEVEPLKKEFVNTSIEDGSIISVTWLQQILGRRLTWKKK